jgi:hypothetical protein
MEDKGVPPHSNCNCVVTKREAERTDEKSFRPWEDVDGEESKEIDKVAKVRKEIMVALLLVCINPNRHEIG